MPEKTARRFAGFAFLTLVTLHGSAAAAEEKKSAAPKMSDAKKIALAVSAGPAEITKNATIIDMTDMSSPKQLRAGMNGWACYAMVNQPMCLDKEWQKWAEAWMGKKQLQLSGPGVAYMLRGDTGASNTDPYATAPTADNQWVVSPAHVMLLYQDPKMLDAYPTDPKSGGPLGDVEGHTLRACDGACVARKGRDDAVPSSRCAARESRTSPVTREQGRPASLARPRSWAGPRRRDGPRNRRP
jgi:hypothetical protein